MVDLRARLLPREQLSFGARPSRAVCRDLNTVTCRLVIFNDRQLRSFTVNWKRTTVCKIKDHLRLEPFPSDDISKTLLRCQCQHTCFHELFSWRETLARSFCLFLSLLLFGMFEIASPRTKNIQPIVFGIRAHTQGQSLLRIKSNLDVFIFKWKSIIHAHLDWNCDWRT